MHKNVIIKVFATNVWCFLTEKEENTCEISQFKFHLTAEVCQCKKKTLPAEQECFASAV